MTKKLIFFIADGFQALDLFGPLDAFMEVNSFLGNEYESYLCSLTAGPVKSAYGQSVIADLAIADVAEVDDLIICGGTGMRTLTLNTKQTLALKLIAERAKRVVSICTGAFILAQIYPDKALTLTTHWRHCPELKVLAKKCEIMHEPLYVQDRNIWSSAGVLSGVDLALALIRQDHGDTIAAKVAKELVVYLQRGGNQTQYSDLLATQTQQGFRLSPLIDWLSHNLDQSISVTKMAEFACVSERQLTRLFKLHLDATPSNYLKLLRLNRARDMLSQSHGELTKVASLVGFVHYDSFRRAFTDHFGVSPSQFLKNYA